MIYKTFEQWKNGNVLEHGVPRTEYYNEDQLDLVEMGWNYGYDAGRAVEQALDKKAENARELGLDYEPVQKRPQNCGTSFCSCIECVMEPAPVQEPDHGDELTIAYMSGVHRGKELAAQRPWVGLTDEEIDKHLSEDAQGDCEMHEFARAIEAKLKEKNGGVV